MLRGRRPSWRRNERVSSRLRLWRRFCDARVFSNAPLSAFLVADSREQLFWRLTAIILDVCEDVPRLSYPSSGVGERASPRPTIAAEDGDRCERLSSRRTIRRAVRDGRGGRQDERRTRLHGCGAGATSRSKRGLGSRGYSSSRDRERLMPSGGGYAKRIGKRNRRQSRSRDDTLSFRRGIRRLSW